GAAAIGPSVHSIDVGAAVLHTNGTPAAAAARATARALSAWAAESTPTGASKKGAGEAVPSRLTRRSRCWFPASIAGRKRQRAKASRLARIVDSPPAPPAM